MDKNQKFGFRKVGISRPNWAAFLNKYGADANKPEEIEDDMQKWNLGGIFLFVKGWNVKSSEQKLELKVRIDGFITPRDEAWEILTKLADRIES